MALLTAYVGMFGQAVRVQREFSGAMSKPWRMVVLNIGAWLMFGLILRERPTRFAGLTVLDWTCLAVVLGCVQTIWIRLARIFRALKDKRSA